MNEMTRIKQKNVYRFLRKFAKNISLDDLELLPRRYGGSIVFFYGEDRILKVPKNGHRAALLKETKLSEYLNTQQLPVTFPTPLWVHDKGFYAVFSRIDGREFTAEALERFTPNEMESFTRSLGAFLSFLHNHKFPDDVMQHIPHATDDLLAQLKSAKRKIKFIKEHSTEVDTMRWEEKLESLQDSLDQVWVVTHCDFSLNHVFSVQGSVKRLAVIDFADAHLHDPSVDFSELAIDLAEEGLVPDNILEMILKHYQTSDRTIAKKIEFGRLTFEIRRAYQQVRNSRKS